MANVTEKQLKNSQDFSRIIHETAIDPIKAVQANLSILREQFFSLTENLNNIEQKFRNVDSSVDEVVEKTPDDAPSVVEETKAAEVEKTVSVEPPKPVPEEKLVQNVETKKQHDASKPEKAKKHHNQPAPDPQKSAVKVVSTFDERGREIKTYTDEKGNVKVRKFLDLSAERAPSPSSQQKRPQYQNGQQRQQGANAQRRPSEGFQNKNAQDKRTSAGGAKPAAFTPAPIGRPQDQKSFGNKNKTHDRPDDKHQSKKNLLTRNYSSGHDFDDDRVVRRARKKSEKTKEEIAAQKITHATVSTEDIPIKVLSEKIGVGVSEIIKQLFKENIFKTINDTLDFDFAAYISEIYGVTLELKAEKSAEEILVENMDEETLSNNVKRPPIVTVMGHVDHGKTSLLDAIRKANVASGEAGGITQHIGAYTVTAKGELITFIDTPGHEAFTAMRARGAKITDVAIIVVAADDGVMPQTVEAVNHAKAAGVSIVVAINKMDKQNVNPDHIKQQLSELELVPEEWGGDTMMIPISAKTHMGIDKLLEAVLTVTELKDLTANSERRAVGTVIEAKLDKGRGAVATILVSNGTLNVGDNIIAGLATGKIRAMFDDKGRPVKSAGPSTPVEALGFSEVPLAGDFLYVADEKLVRKAAEERKNKIKVENAKAAPQMNLGDLFGKISEGQLKTLNLIIKTDVQGSLEALKSSLEKISNDEVKVRPIHGGVGAINETDIMLARASNAIVIGFNVRSDSNAKVVAEKEGVDVRLYNIIYDAVDDVTSAMKGLLAPKFKEASLGTVEVREVFKIGGVGTIAGSYVTSGKVLRTAKLRVYRNDVCVYDGAIKDLKRFKDDVKEVASGYECGITIENYNDIKVGDVFEIYQMEEIER